MKYKNSAEERDALSCRMIFTIHLYLPPRILPNFICPVIFHIRSGDHVLPCYLKFIFELVSC